MPIYFSIKFRISWVKAFVSAISMFNPDSTTFLSFVFISRGYLKQFFFEFFLFHFHILILFSKFLVLRLQGSNLFFKFSLFSAYLLHIFLHFLYLVFAPLLPLKSCLIFPPSYYWSRYSHFSSVIFSSSYFKLYVFWNLFLDFWRTFVVISPTMICAEVPAH